MDDERQMTRSAGLVGIFTLISRILGLIRDAFVAALFPKGATDPFFVAFTIPNVMRQLLAEGALTGSFIPIFTEHKENRGEKAAAAMLANLLGAALLVLVTVVLLGILFAPWVVRIFAFGLAEDPDKLRLAVHLTRILFFYLLCVGLTALAMGVLNTYKRFLSPALSPSVLNLAIIGTAYVTVSSMRSLGLPMIDALALGVIVGGICQVILQLPFLARERMLVWPRFGLLDPGVKRIGKLMLPSVLGLAIYQVNIVLSRQFASFLPEGCISALYYSQRLIEFPMGIFAVAIATVALPNLSLYANAKNSEGMIATYRFALGLVLFIMLPASIGLGVLSVPLCSVLFQRGEFSHEMARQTAVTLEGFLVGMWAGAGVRQTVPVFYALQDTKTPVKAAVITVFFYVVFAWLLYRPYQTLGLSLSVSIASIANFLLLLYFLKRRIGSLSMKALGGSLWRSAIATALAGGGAHAVSRLGQWELGGAHASNYAILMAAVGVGLLLYALGAYVLRIPELGELFAAVRKKK
jgi:putative peptidoglycan lipid II flippase